MQNKILIIAEIAQAHDGSLGILHSLIDSISSCGVDIIKFQTHIAEAESSAYEPFRVNFSYVDKTRFDYWKRMGFTKEQWIEIKSHCEKVRTEFMSSPFSCAAVNLLEEINVKRYKIGSGEINNFLMLEKIAKTKKDIILSSGMSNFAELDECFNFLKFYGNNLSILQCTTKYPTPPEEIGLNILDELKERYNLPVGLSDHSGTIYPSIAAVARGAKIIEVHVTFDKKIFGPDSVASLTIDELKQLVEAIRYLEKSFNNIIDKNDNTKYSEIKKIFGKTLSVNKDLKIGHVLAFDDLESKKPLGMGIPSKEYKKVLGHKLKVNKKKYEFLKEDDLI